MPKTLHHSIRMDSTMKFRISDTFLSEIKVLAKKRGISLSDFVRQTLQEELDRDRTKSK